jgi:hypothetical protein
MDGTIWARAGWLRLPGDFCVRVRAHQRPNAYEGPDLKVVIQTDFVKDIAIDSGHFEKKAEVASHFVTSTYAWIYALKSPGNEFDLSGLRPALWFSSSGYISSKIVGWMTELLANTGIIQPIDAQTQAAGVSKMLGTGSPDTSRPEALKDAGLDEILKVVAVVYAPLGKRPSRWVGTDEFEKFAEQYGRSDACFGFGDPSGMTLETPFGADSALITFRTDEKHPQLGHGLSVTLQLPFLADRLTIAKEAAALNLLEYLSWTGFPQLGCWHLRQSRGEQYAVAFSLFLPNALYKPVLVTNIAFWFLMRARWVREKRFPKMKDLTMLEILNERHGQNGAP